MRTVTKKAYGKINLILKVGDKRDDGRHEVLTVMQKVGVYDTVTVSETDIGGISIECSDPALANEDNIAFKAARGYFEVAGITPSVKISIEKRIPVTAGMAGGSSDAGATLTALEEMYGALGESGIYSIAATLGADVPFFIYKDKTMLGRGTGTLLTSFPSVLGELYGLFVVTGIEKPSTGEMYRLLDEAKGDTKTALDGAEAGLRLAIEKADTDAAVDCFTNDFTLCNPHVYAFEKKLSSLGAKKTLLCGSGPTVCGIFTDKNAAEKAAGDLEHKTFVCMITGEEC